MLLTGDCAAATTTCYHYDKKTAGIGAVLVLIVLREVIDDDWRWKKIDEMNLILLAFPSC